MDAVRYSTAAMRAPDTTARLDAALRAMTSFDHALDSARELPVQWLVPGIGKYLRGYEAAKQAVSLLVASGVIPGARERVGRQTVLAAREYFASGARVGSADRSRFGGHVAKGWLSASLEDASSGVLMLRPDMNTARTLLSGIEQARNSAARRKGVDESLARMVDSIFGQLTSTFDERIAAAERTEQPAALDPSLIAHVDSLLEEARIAAEALRRDVPAPQTVDAWAAAS
jgi:hypothetical protein